MAQGDRLLSAGHDRNIKLWSLNLPNVDSGEDMTDTQETDAMEEVAAASQEAVSKPLIIYPGTVPFKYVSYEIAISSTNSEYSSIHHHRHLPLFATASNGVHVWDETKTKPVTTLTFGSSISIIPSTLFLSICLRIFLFIVALVVNSSSDII